MSQITIVCTHGSPCRRRKTNAILLHQSRLEWLLKNNSSWKFSKDSGHLSPPNSAIQEFVITSLSNPSGLIPDHKESQPHYPMGSNQTYEYSRSGFKENHNPNRAKGKIKKGESQERIVGKCLDEQGRFAGNNGWWLLSKLWSSHGKEVHVKRSMGHALRPQRPSIIVTRTCGRLDALPWSANLGFAVPKLVICWDKRHLR